MTDLQKKAAVVLAVVDKIENGNEAKPSGYWGVGPLEKSHALDSIIKDMNPDDLKVVLNALTGEVA